MKKQISYKLPYSVIYLFMISLWFMILKDCCGVFQFQFSNFWNSVFETQVDIFGLPSEPEPVLTVLWELDKDNPLL